MTYVEHWQLNVHMSKYVSVKFQVYLYKHLNMLRNDRSSKSHGDSSRVAYYFNSPLVVSRETLDAEKTLKPRRFSLGPIDLVEDISLLYHCFTLPLEQGLLVVVMITDKGRHFHTSMRISAERTDK